MSNTDSITIKLSNNDFFYISAKDMPSDVSCNDTDWQPDSGNCVPENSKIYKNADFLDVLDECKIKYKTLWSYTRNGGNSDFITGITPIPGNYAKLVNDLDNNGGSYAKWAGGLVLYNNNTKIDRIYWLWRTDEKTYLQLSSSSTNVYLKAVNANSDGKGDHKGPLIDIQIPSDINDTPGFSIDYHDESLQYLDFGVKLDENNSLYTTDGNFKLTIDPSGDLVLIYRSKDDYNPSISTEETIIKQNLYNKGQSYLDDYNNIYLKQKFITSLNNEASTWTTNGSNCYKKELCKNKEKANEINNLQNNHLGTDQNYLNSKVIYSVELRRGISLSIGILILFGTIIYSKGK